MGAPIAMLALLAVVQAAAAAPSLPPPLLEAHLPSEPISIRYRPGSEAAVMEVSRIASTTAPELARAFGVDSLPPLTLQLERTTGDFEGATGGRAPDWGAAMAFPRQRLAIFDLAACARHPRGLPAVVRHELSHLLFAHAADHLATPAWFSEGLALVQASEWNIGDSWTLLEGRLRGELPSLEDLDAAFPRRGDDADVAYRLSMRAMSGILRGAPPGALADLAMRCRSADTFEQAFEETFGYSIESYSARFSRDLRRGYGWATLVSSVPFFFGFMSVLFLLAFGAKKFRARRTLARWAEEDRANPAPVIPFPAHRIPPANRQGPAEQDPAPEETPPGATPG